MKITLTTQDDIVQYLNFLHQTDRLTAALAGTVVDEPLSSAFVKYLSSSNDTTSSTPSSDTEAWQGKKRWTTEERAALSALIAQNHHPQAIGNALGRSEDGVRHQARTYLDLAFNNGKWVDTNFT